MAKLPRYAIYFSAEPHSALDRFGAELLGYDAHRGVDVPFPAGLPADWPEITQDPRKYGFHATLKAPMRLASAATEDQLITACAAFACTPRAIASVTPIVDIIDGFIAVVPAAPSADLARLAADCVREFEPFRAPLTEQDRARRNPSRLTVRQRDYLDRWGYPYVFEEFRFHMTLTGRLEADQQAPIVEMLRDRFRPVGTAALIIDSIALVRQHAPDQRFVVIARWPFQRAAP